MLSRTAHHATPDGFEKVLAALDGDGEHFPDEDALFETVDFSNPRENE